MSQRPALNGVLNVLPTYRPHKADERPHIAINVLQ